MTIGGGTSYCLAMASSLLEELAGVGDLAGHGGCGRGGRRAQVDERFRVTHASVKVAVGGAQADLAVGEDALVDAHAGAATGVGDHGARLPEHLEQAFGGGSPRDRPGCGSDDHACPLSLIHISEPTRLGM